MPRDPLPAITAVRTQGESPFEIVLVAGKLDKRVFKNTAQLVEAGRGVGMRVVTEPSLSVTCCVALSADAHLGQAFLSAKQLFLRNGRTELPTRTFEELKHQLQRMRSTAVTAAASDARGEAAAAPASAPRRASLPALPAAGGQPANKRARQGAAPASAPSSAQQLRMAQSYAERHSCALCSAPLAAKQGENGVFIKCDNWNLRDATGRRICNASIDLKTVFDWYTKENTIVVY